MLREVFFKLGSPFLKNHPPRWIIVLIDLFIALFSLLLAFYIRLNFDFNELFSYPLAGIAVIFILARLSVYFIFGMYSGLIRFSTFRDIERVISVTFCGSLIIVLVNILYSMVLTDGLHLIPSGVVIMEFLLTTILMISLRLFVKTLYMEMNFSRTGLTNVVIYGVSDISGLMIQAIDESKDLKCKVVGLLSSVDDNDKCTGNTLGGVRIYDMKDLPTLVLTRDVKGLVLAAGTLDASEKEELVKKCSDLHVRMMTFPVSRNDFSDGKASVNVRDMRIEDLLERPQIKLDKDAVRKEIKGKTVFVSGAAGSIGSELVRQIAGFSPKRIILFDQAETPLHSFMLELKEKQKFKDFEIVLGDVHNRDRITALFIEYKPEIVFHAAAYKHVPMLEDNPKEAFRTNIAGTKNMADIANKFGVKKFIMISTDKAVRPTNIMGASKRVAEMYIQGLSRQEGTKTAFVTTRFGNVLGSNGSVVERFREQIEKGGPLTVTHPDMKRYFMTIPEAVQLVMEASAMGEGGEIFVFDMGEMVKISDLAAKMIRLCGLIPGEDIEIKYTGLRPGERLYEVLLADKEQLLPTYNSKIMRAKIEDVDFKRLNDLIESLHNDLHIYEKSYIVSVMKEIMPEFKSENSAYAILD